jgi:(p)ppGpp synthase/HD superfamily hydrolase
MSVRSRFPDLIVRLPKTNAAVAFARSCHAGQRRRVDGAAFIMHPLEVGSLLYYAGAPDHVIAAGVLHDTVEKTDVDGATIAWRFGPKIAGIVLAVSEDDTIKTYEERKRALREQVTAAGPDALMVLAADKISKARELRLPSAGGAASADPIRKRQRRVAHYQSCLRLLEEDLPHSPLTRELRGELEQLAATEPALA